ncbi:hypothetical protein ATANTOWER_000948 [Ataeniobius toweri]|uniref:Uncharacterized protein n=1 Tax=Ataeniobius toweri TaxID=208326 RepID=A0ABU7BCZ8_9TELE|nr:hypothetical protein [Ataeniobius toweri]
MQLFYNYLGSVGTIPSLPDGSEEKRGGGHRVTHVRDQLKNGELLIRPRRGKYEKPLQSTESTRRKTRLLGNKPEGFPPAPGVGGVFNQYTKFQLSNSSRNGRVEEKFACKLLSPDMRLRCVDP